MSRIVRVSQSDYRVKVQNGGTITLDTGAEQGLVVITGDLTVLGNSTSIDTTNMVVQDNILVINREVDADGNPITHTGITLGQAGIEIDRGTLTNAQLLFDEDVQHYDPLTDTNKDGTFIFKTKDGALSGLQVAAISASTSTDLTFDLQNTTNMLKIVNVTAYGSRVVDDNHIPNKKYIDDYVASGIVVPGMADVDRIYYSFGGVEKAKVQATVSNIQFKIALNLRAQITSTGLDVDNINLFGHTITSSGGNNLILTATNNNVEVNAILNLDDQSGTITGTSGTNRIYSKSIVGPGKSGIFFANTTTTDELVAKDRALLFSMLF